MYRQIFVCNPDNDVMTAEFSRVPNVTVTQHVTIEHRLSEVQAAKEEITLGPSVSILGCKHVVSQ